MTELVLLRELAEEFGLNRSNVLKYLKARQIPTVFTRTKEGRWQREVALTPDDAKRARQLRADEGFLQPRTIIQELP